jgi:lysophospholipase L1-like esterase
MLLKNNTRLLMTGDSITDCGRARPLGEGSKDNNLGTGYVALVDALLQAAHPDLKIRVMNTGLSGDTSRGLLARWQDDVSGLAPDWLSIMIGINDIWRQLDEPCRTEDHVLPEEYAANIEEMLCRAAGKFRVALLSPFFAEPRREDAMRALCDQYAGICRELSKKHGAVFVDTQAAFDRYLLCNSSMRMTWDRVHPNLTGHLMIAQAFVDAVS